MSDMSPAPGLVPGGRFDDHITFTPLKIAVLTVSDTRDEESDTSGSILATRISTAGHLLGPRAIVADDVTAIRTCVQTWIAENLADAIITTGGTGLTGRDVTPEALEPLFTKKIDGFSVVFHLVSYQSIGLSTLQSRATAGLIDTVPVFCLPGSNGAVRDGWDKVISAQLSSQHRPCNLVELMPRFAET
jgi:molybdenum cofactor biosynthesis protein B